jgi:hypothetical protein
VFGAQRSKFGKPQDRPVWQRTQGDPTTRQPVDKTLSVENSLYSWVGKSFFTCLYGSFRGFVGEIGSDIA